MYAKRSNSAAGIAVLTKEDIRQNNRPDHRCSTYCNHADNQRVWCDRNCLSWQDDVKRAISGRQVVSNDNSIEVNTNVDSSLKGRRQPNYTASNARYHTVLKDHMRRESTAQLERRSTYEA